MRRFLFKITVFVLLVVISFVWVLSLADGFTDPFYIRFTTPKQNNLIIGTSRAAQGLQPDVLNFFLNRDFYNYAFTMGHSPFGPSYLKSIKKKLNSDEKNGVFIVTVDPWSISSTTTNPNDSLNFREVNLCVANTPKVNIKPNFSYLINNLGGNFYKIVLKNSPMYLHTDGWLEVTLDMDSSIVSKRLKNKLDDYRNNYLPTYKFSNLRMEYLIKTIKFLNKHGKVYLVRLPIDSKLMEIENEFMPDFGDKIQSIIPFSNGYFDMTQMNNEFSYVDGNHLYKVSGELVSEKIADWINKE